MRVEMVEITSVDDRVGKWGGVKTYVSDEAHEMMMISWVDDVNPYLLRNQQ